MRVPPLPPHVPPVHVPPIVRPEVVVAPRPCAEPTLCSDLRRVEDLLAPPATTKPEPRPYAVSPIGGPMPTLAAPPRPAEDVRAINWFQVTNLGSVVDLLA